VKVFRGEGPDDKAHGAGEHGLFYTKTREVADTHAAHRKGGKVHAAKLNAWGFPTWDLKGDAPTKDTLAERVAHAKKRGAAGIRLKNVGDIATRDGKQVHHDDEQFLVFDTARLKRDDAPRKRSGYNLL